MGSGADEAGSDDGNDGGKCGVNEGVESPFGPL
jgi:hypothetical protein